MYISRHEPFQSTGLPQLTPQTLKYRANSQKLIYNALVTRYSVLVSFIGTTTLHAHKVVQPSKFKKL